MDSKLIMKYIKSWCASALCVIGLIAGLSGCVDQHPQTTQTTGDNQAIIATSAATADICNKLNIDLVGVCETSHELPEKYKSLPTVGSPMKPDMEVIKSLNPDYVLSPATLRNDLEPKYKKAGVQYYFLDLKSVNGMYNSIVELGEKFNRQQEAAKLKAEYDAYIKEYRKTNEGKQKPRVLILMGLPGSYLVATPKSYVGSLVELAGGENVFADSQDEFLNVNTEELKAIEPDIILRAAHGVPDEVVAMFAEEFNTNQIWKHFKAVQNGKVYDLDSNLFGMSANFDYPQALEALQPMLYN